MPGLNLPFAPDTRRVRRDGLPPVREFRAEICVVGAGIAGTSAANSAVVRYRPSPGHANTVSVSTAPSSSRA